MKLFPISFKKYSFYKFLSTTKLNYGLLINFQNQVCHVLQQLCHLWLGIKPKSWYLSKFKHWWKIPDLSWRIRMCLHSRDVFHVNTSNIFELMHIIIVMFSSSLTWTRKTFYLKTIFLGKKLDLMTPTQCITYACSDVATMAIVKRNNSAITLKVSVHVKNKIFINVMSFFWFSSSFCN